jgi:hypothetical protein
VCPGRQVLIAERPAGVNPVDGATVSRLLGTSAITPAEELEIEPMTACFPDQE